MISETASKYRTDRTISDRKNTEDIVAVLKLWKEVNIKDGFMDVGTA